jgi:hypothetical protein
MAELGLGATLETETAPKADGSGEDKWDTLWRHRRRNYLSECCPRQVLNLFKSIESRVQCF